MIKNIRQVLIIKNNNKIWMDNKVVYSFARRKKILTRGIHVVFRGLKIFSTPQTGKLRSYPPKLKNEDKQNVRCNTIQNSGNR